MKKIILEILTLVWKVLKVTVWKWLGPWIGRIAVLFLIGVAIITVLGVLLAHSC